VIQVTERDEFSYQEMIAHLPICALEVSDRDSGRGLSEGTDGMQEAFLTMAWVIFGPAV
jgi:hypothetical protein